MATPANILHNTINNNLAAAVLLSLVAVVVGCLRLVRHQE